jgi:hypothetical protein
MSDLYTEDRGVPVFRDGVLDGTGAKRTGETGKTGENTE